MSEYELIELVMWNVCRYIFRWENTKTGLLEDDTWHYSYLFIISIDLYLYYLISLKVSNISNVQHHN